jgi:hypothetical protein
MKAKKFLSLLSLALITAAMYANDDIPLRQEDGPGPDEPTIPRSIENELTASIDDQVVTVSFSELTASQIVVTDSANQTVFNQTYPAAYSAQADLSSLPAGSYTIHIYAYGAWWYGYLDLQ